MKLHGTFSTALSTDPCSTWRAQARLRRNFLLPSFGAIAIGRTVRATWYECTTPLF